MRRRTMPEPVAPPAPPQRLLEPVVEDWVSPSEVQALTEAQTVAEARWRDAVNQWKSTPGAHLVLALEWDRSYLVGNLKPAFRDRDAFEWSIVMT